MMAVKEINDAGGIDGKKIRVITYDDQGKPTEAAAATTKLIVQDKIHVLLGEVASSRSLAMAPIAQAQGVPMVTPSSTNPKVTEGKSFVFRVCFIDPFQGSVMAKFASENLKMKKIAILRDVGNDYSVGLANFFQDKLKQLGGEIAIDQSYQAGDIDFKAQLTAIKAAAPEAIFVPGYYTDVALIARQARELGIKVPLLGGDGWESAKLFQIGGSALEGSYFSNHYAVEDPAAGVQKFIDDYSKIYFENPDSLAALGYDAARVAAAAVSRAKSVKGDDIRRELQATKDFPGVTGNITINEERNAVKPAVVLKIEGQVAHYQTSIAP
jgi:branched-chain amino acid transport system substrate-binding protein